MPALDPAKRQAILDAALRLIAERGFHDAPMAELAKRAGVAAGTIYRYFEGKEALINELYVELKGDMYRAVAAPDAARGEFKPFFMGLWDRFLDYFLAKPEAFLFMEQYAHSPYLAQQARDQAGAAFQPIVARFQEAQAAGTIMEGPVDLVFALLHGILAALARRQVQAGIPVTPDVRRIAAEAAWRAISR